MFVERTGVDGPRDVEEAGPVTFVDCGSLDGCQLDAVERLGSEIVHQQSLHDLDDLTDGAGREVIAPDRREAARRSVEIEHPLIHMPMLP